MCVLVVLLLKQLPIELGGNYSTMLAGRVRDGAQKGEEQTELQRRTMQKNTPGEATSDEH